MMLRIFLAVLMIGAVGLCGCKKKEPTVGERIDRLKKEAEKTAEDVADDAEDLADEAQDMLDDAQR